MIIQKIKISELKPAPYNPRKIKKEELKKLEDSMDKFGYIDPIIYNKRTGHVVGGHQRLSVISSKLSPDSEIDVSVVDLDEFQEKTLNIALNRITGMWDDEKLEQLLQNIREYNTDMLKYTGYDESEITKILKLNKIGLDDGIIEVGAYERAKQKSKIKSGDIFILGTSRLMCGDATNQADVSKLMNNKKANMTFTDPPYNVNYGSIVGHPSWKRTQGTPNKGDPYWEERKDKGIGNFDRIQNDNLSEEDWSKFVEGYMLNILAMCDGAIYICMSNKEMYSNKHIFEKLGGHWASFIIWKKDSFVLGMQDYQRQYEPILYGWVEGKKHYWCGDRNQSDIWEIARPKSSPEHPTMKPIELCKRAIFNNSKEKEIVLDLFGGSGSTLIACEQINRQCYMMELDPIYCQIIIDRYEKLTGIIATKLSNEQ